MSSSNRNSASLPRHTSAVNHSAVNHVVGRPKIVTEDYLQRLKELVSHDPRKFGYPFRRWTAYWLNQHLDREYNISVSNRHINRLLKQMGLSTRTAYAASPQDWMPPASRITIHDLPAKTRTESAPEEESPKASMNRLGTSLDPSPTQPLLENH